MYWLVFQRFYSYAVWVVCVYCSLRCSFIYYLCIGFFVFSPLLKRKRLDARKLNVWRGALAFPAWVRKSTEQNRTKRHHLKFSFSTLAQNAALSCAYCVAQSSYYRLFTSLAARIKKNENLCLEANSMGENTFHTRKKKNSGTWSCRCWSGCRCRQLSTFFLSEFNALRAVLARHLRLVRVMHRPMDDSSSLQLNIRIQHCLFFFAKLAATATLPY